MSRHPERPTPARRRKLDTVVNVAILVTLAVLLLRLVGAEQRRESERCVTSPTSSTDIVAGRLLFDSGESLDAHGNSILLRTEDDLGVHRAVIREMAPAGARGGPKDRRSGA